MRPRSCFALNESLLGWCCPAPPPPPCWRCAAGGHGSGAGYLPGGLKERTKQTAARTVFVLQRRTTKPGKDLGKTTGWIHRKSLQHRNVEFIGGVKYVRVDDLGLHIEVEGTPRVLAVDNVVVCAGQVSEDGLAAPLREAGLTVHVVGGADEASELDAKRAIKQGAEVAAAL